MFESSALLNSTLGFTLAYQKCCYGNVSTLESRWPHNYRTVFTVLGISWYIFLGSVWVKLLSWIACMKIFMVGAKILNGWAIRYRWLMGPLLHLRAYCSEMLVLFYGLMIVGICSESWEQWQSPCVCFLCAATVSKCSVLGRQGSLTLSWWVMWFFSPLTNV